MNYGKGPAAVAPGVAMLPTTGANDNLFIVAASLIALGVAVYVISLVMARKSRQISES
ncbi:MAG TPA: LPXTG cell wall anchor domain-containing protein [Candidatus Saccharimonadales bacterium]|nr:LPXTG cell wall anchor domain-containing protein [Candidatus Saccharimonadales bacterium]